MRGFEAIRFRTDPLRPPPNLAPALLSERDRQTQICLSAICKPNSGLRIAARGEESAGSRCVCYELTRAI